MVRCNGVAFPLLERHCVCLQPMLVALTALILIGTWIAVVLSDYKCLAQQQEFLSHQMDVKHLQKLQSAIQHQLIQSTL